MRFLTLLAVLVLMVSSAPVVLAQSPISGCTRECDPLDVNSGVVKKGDEPVTVILYAHFEDALAQAPLNTQKPDPVQERDLNAGFLMPVLDTTTGLGCPGTCLDVHFRNNEFTLISSPGFVEYGTDRWRTHTEPGLAEDATIAAKEFNLYFYLSSYAIPGQNSHGAYPDVGAMPQVAVLARVETGRHTWSSKSTVIAESAGIAEPLSPRRVNLITQPNEPDVYEYQVPMKVVTNTIPNQASAQGFVVYIAPYQIRTHEDPDAQNAVQVTQEEWRLRTGHKYPTRLVVPVERTMMTKASSMNIFDNKFFVRWSLVSVWGSYDMRDNDLKLESVGPTKVAPETVDLVTFRRGVDHDAHFKPANATWMIDLAQHRLADGDYEFVASIPNLQGTYLLEERFAFRVENGIPQVPVIGRPPTLDGPVGREEASGEAAGVAWLGVIVAAVLATWSRRRT